MTEVTRVPLKPISKGSLLMLVVGILIGIALSAAYAYFTVPRVSVSTVTAGTGESPKPDDVVFVRYVGKLDDGTVFDQSQDLQLPIPGIVPEGTPMPLENMLPGFRDALVKMKKGGKYVAKIPAELAYGANPPPGAPIPANADLTFEIELVDFMPMAEAEQRFQRLQQRMMEQQQGAAGAAADGVAPAAPVPAPAPAPAQ
ncbi:MAG TPA: FKBP-type peptidyl-prolyl cis-trans isomerase [Croceibacterium sp.]|nr:FKBP-type peptidyl-prolyl cis-trans isomerase [Croceibacterium sp.]